GWDICSGIGSISSTSEPMLSASSTEFNYGSFTTTSQPPVTHTITYTNNSGTTLNLVPPKIVSSGSNFDEFYISSNGCSGSLAPGASCPISVTFDPGGLSGNGISTIADELNLGSNALNSALMVRLNA